MIASGSKTIQSGIGLRPTRPFSAYQTICASDLFPWQPNLEVVYGQIIVSKSISRLRDSKLKKSSNDAHSSWKMFFAEENVLK